MKIKPEETEIIGKILSQDNTVINSDTCNRINNLTADYLIKITTDNSGWNVLYQDPEDKRYWEKVYLQSEMHGGGPPSLINISEDEVKKKYHL